MDFTASTTDSFLTFRFYPPRHTCGCVTPVVAPVERALHSSELLRGCHIPLEFHYSLGGLSPHLSRSSAVRVLTLYTAVHSGF